MSKIKMRCITCGKWFQSANAKEVTCPDCTQKARKEKMAAKTTPATQQRMGGPGAPGPASRPAVPPPPKPKPASGTTSHWLDTVNDVKVSEPEQPVVRPKLPATPAPDTRDNRGGPERTGQRGPGGPGGPGTYREAPRGPGGYREGGYRGPGSYRENEYRGPGAYRSGGSTLGGTIGQRPRQPMEGGPGRGPRPGGPGRPGEKKAYKPGPQKPPKPPAPPKPRREKIPPPAPFMPTPEQVAQVEARYKELAVPSEFDGIRTQISQELTIPKSAVKKIIKALRDREGLPSWWETQTYKGNSEDLEKIKKVYEPYLPVPPVGVHKKIAEELSLKPSEIYQAIKAIRIELNLPQYNDPTLHGEELTQAPRHVENGQQQEKAASTDAGPAPATAETAPTGSDEATSTNSGETAPSAAAEPGEAVASSDSSAAASEQ